MPSDEMVEKARAEAEKNWPPLKLALWHVVTGAELNGSGYVNAYDLTDKLYAAALAAAEAGEPVGYVAPQSMKRFQEDPTAQIFIRVFAAGHLTANGKNLSEYVSLYASPPSEASRDERAVPVTPTNRTIVGGFLNNGDGHGFTVDVPITKDERAAIRKEAFEEAALIADAQAVSDHGDWCNAKPEDKAYHLWAKQTAEAIATAIRARGET